MSYPNVLPEVLTPKEIADYLKINVEAVLKELSEGRLRGFKIGPEWRCTHVSLLEYINRNYTITTVSQQENPRLEYDTADFVEIGAFTYKWPLGEENFETGFETTRNINGHAHSIRIGFTNRNVAGQLRRKVVIWINNWPVVEFAGSNNYETDRLLAGVIKLQGGKQLRPTGKIPEEYRGFRIARYDSIVQGPNASRNMAVIVLKDDLESMLRHAIIRATWKQLI